MRVGWFGMKPFLEWCWGPESLASKLIDQVTSTHKCIIPKSKWDRTMGKQGKTGFDDMMVFCLCNTILLMGVRTGNTMVNSYRPEIGIEMLIFPSPITLNSQDLGTKKMLNMSLKLKKYTIDITFIFDHVDP
jgi:hypothetical protein